VRAGIPEELDHFDLAGRRLHGGALLDHAVLLAFDGTELRACELRGADAGEGERRARGH
jgi:hypothetical protein